MMDNNEKTMRTQNSVKALEFAAELEAFSDDYYGLAYPAMIEEAGGKDTFIRETAHDILYHKTGYLKEELQSIVDEDDEMSAQAQGLLDRLSDLATQIVDTRPEVLPVSFDTFPDCNLSNAEYVLENGEKLRHCTYEPDFFMSENRLADGTFTMPRFYEAMWDAEGLPVSFRRTDEVQLISQPIAGRMEEQTFSSAVHHLLPDSTPEAVNTWIVFAKECVDGEQYVDFVEESAPIAAERWLNNIYSGLKAVKEDFGEPIANQVCELAAIQSCLYPGEMCNAAQYLQEGRTPQEISNMVSNSELDSAELSYPERRDSFQPENLYHVKIESPYEAVGPEIGIVREGVVCGFNSTRRTEPGYLLKDGTALLECERDAYGNYHGGAGMEGLYLKTGKLYAPVMDAQGTIQAFRNLHNRMEREQERDVNPLEAVEMGSEQNYNMLDGIINNQEPPRVNQGYTIIDSEIVGHKEFVLAESPTAPQPYVTWARNIQNDEQTGGENFFWGHYFTDPDRARDDLHSRVREEEQDLAEHRPSILSQLKSDAARTDLPTAPEPGRKKDAPER